MRRRRGGREGAEGQRVEQSMPLNEGSEIQRSQEVEPTMPYSKEAFPKETKDMQETYSGALLRTVLPPPTTLIRDDLQRLRDNDLYRGAFFIRDEKAEDQDDDESSLDAYTSQNSYFEQEDTSSHTAGQFQGEVSYEEQPFLHAEEMEETAYPELPKDLT